MYICRNCGQTFSSPVSFCNKCGSNAVDYQGAEQYTPVTPYPAAPSGASNGPSIVGMIFGIISMFISFIFLIASSALVEEYGRYLRFAEDEVYGLIAGFSFFILPFLIVGLILSFKKSNLKGMAIAGKILNFIALSLYLISTFSLMSAL